VPKLRVNIISKGKYWRAFEDIPEDELPEFAKNYLATESEIQQQADNSESKIRKPKKKSFVKRGDDFVLASKVELIAGETLFWVRKRSFGVPETFIPFGKV
jgi:hypothetical protein